MTGTNFSNGKSGLKRPRSLPVSEWPDADRHAWEEACRPGSRLKPGGVASYLAQVSRDSFARRYGAFLAFLDRNGRLHQHSAAAAQVTPTNVAAYIDELTARVRSVTYNCIYHLRRAAELLAPTIDFSWLAEIEKDLALVMEPRSKSDRLVLSERLVEAGLTLVIEAQQLADNDFARARGIRNGLMIALLAVCPNRLKNFSTLEIGHTFKQVHGSWWIAVPAALTKSRRRPDERRVPGWLNNTIDLYLNQSRPVLLRSGSATNALWISSTTAGPMTTKNLGTLVSKVTLETLGVDVSPHLFRTAAASTAATYGGRTPHLASAILNHTDPRVTEKHYNRASSMSASKIYARITAGFLQD
jgi:integrase